MATGQIKNDRQLRAKKALATLLSHILFALPLLMAAMTARLVRSARAKPDPRKLRLLWAGAPLLSLKTASAALASAGYNSRTIANTLYQTATPQDFDKVLALKRRYPFGLNTFLYTGTAVATFMAELFKADVLHGFFDGAMLGRTPLAWLEYPLWKVSGGKLILMPYGSDAFVHSKLPDAPWAKALVETYPRTLAEDRAVMKRIKLATARADRIVGCLVHDFCLPRVDDHPLLWYPFDQSIKPEYRAADTVVEIVHVANHPLIKGSQILSKAVEELKSEGYPVELKLLVGVSHSEALQAISKAHIFVDQLLFGYALAALEGMAFGKPTISCIEPDTIIQGYHDRGQLHEHAIISAGVTSIKSVLKNLLENKDQLQEIGRKSRLFVDEAHGNQSVIALYCSIYLKLHS